jgi:hypothetical protein
MGFLENFDLKKGTGWMAAAQAAPALIGAFQANKARRDYNKTVKKIEDYQRQDIINPYQNLSNTLGSSNTSNVASLPNSLAIVCAN